MAQLLGNVSVGTIVKLKENGVAKDFYVAKHDYESSLNGAGRTLVVRKDTYDDRVWDSSNVNAYASSELDSWFNGTYKGLLDDYIQDMTLETTRGGRMVFTRLNHRLVNTNPICFSCDIVGHGADWRESMAWICNRYPEFFEPENPLAQTMGGTAAYTNHDVDFDVEKMKRMAFRVNWRASFDFPYMGMFLPPVGRNEEWTRFGGGNTSQAGMADYAARMKEMGFCVLNYFNVTEFGARVSQQEPPRSTAPGEEWKNCDPRSV